MVTLTTTYKVTPNSPIIKLTGILASDGTSASIDYCQNVMEGSNTTVNRIVVLRKEISGVEQYEKCLCTARSATSGPGTLTITRAQAGTSAREWPVDTELAVVLTSEHINNIIDNMIAVNSAVEGTITQCGVHGDTSGNGAHAKIYLLAARVTTLEGHDATLSGGSTTDADTLHTHASLLPKAFAAVANKTTIHDSDTLIINDSEASAAIKEVTALVLRGTTHKNLDIAARTLIINASGCKIPAYASDVAVGSVAKTAAISNAATSSGVTLTCTSTTHGLKSGEVVYLKLDDPTTYNGNYAVTVTNAGEFTVTLPETPSPNVDTSGNVYVIGEVSTMLFAAGTAKDSFIEAHVVMPENYNGGTFTAKAIFIPDNDCSDDTTVKFTIEARMVGTTDKLGGAYGTPVTITTAVSSTDLLRRPIHTAESGAITPAASPTPAGGKTLWLRIGRYYNDTCAVGIHLDQIRILYNTDAYGDQV